MISVKSDKKGREFYIGYPVIPRNTWVFVAADSPKANPAEVVLLGIILCYNMWMEMSNPVRDLIHNEIRSKKNPPTTGLKFMSAHSASLTGSNQKKNILILGAGFGGITAALKLVKCLGPRTKEYDIILVDRHHHQLFTPSLYRIAAIPHQDADTISLKSSILINLSDIFDPTPIRLLTDEIVGLHPENKKILLKSSGEFEFGYLIIALGSETAYFEIPGLSKYGFPLKTFDDALRLRNAIEKKYLTQPSLKIVVGGGGATGVELAAEFVGFICELGLKLQKPRNVCEVEFVLIEAAPEILPGFPGAVVQKTKKRLKALGVKTLTGSKINGLTEKEVFLENGAQEAYDIFIWTGGVEGPKIFRNAGFSLSAKKEIMTDEYLQARGYKNIFVVGDNAAFINPKTGKELPWNVPIAEAEGRLAAQNIVRAIYGQPLKKFRPLGRYPFILAVGRRYAIADLLIIRVFGILGWMAKGLVELRYFLFILPFRKALRTWLKSIRTL